MIGLLAAVAATVTIHAGPGIRQWQTPERMGTLTSFAFRVDGHLLKNDYAGDCVA